MQIRVCDRCRVEVVAVPEAAAVRGVTIPPELPAASPVAVAAAIDVTLSLAVKAPADLCDVCKLSAMAEYIARALRATSDGPTIKTLAARIAAILKGTV